MVTEEGSRSYDGRILGQLDHEHVNLLDDRRLAEQFRGAGSQCLGYLAPQVRLTA